MEKNEEMNEYFATLNEDEIWNEGIKMLKEYHFIFLNSVNDIYFEDDSFVVEFEYEYNSESLEGDFEFRYETQEHDISNATDYAVTVAVDVLDDILAVYETDDKRIYVSEEALKVVVKVMSESEEDDIKYYHYDVYDYDSFNALAATVDYDLDIK
ncbi:hypothetical protein [Enterococcus casseliflavus]|uniref:hypothetical protein n=1 Tax=Enterococcus casseliflavus TaxID=37734 RepID=UPI0025430D7C|nr:hypothetical protein [Enterococcus casseliflavus]MDK4448986.1 hypothetical protein [Enterococcus casseliflavus]